MLRQFSTRRIVTFFLIDWLGTLGLLFLAALLRARLGNLPQPILDLLTSLEIPEAGTFANWPTAKLGYMLSWQVFFIVALIWPFFFIVFSVYDGRRNETLKAELLNVFMATCVSIMTLAGILYFTYRETSRVLFAIFFLMDAALLLSGRVLLWAYRHAPHVQQQAQRKAVLIVGAGQVGKNAVAELAKCAWANIELVGYADDDPDKQNQLIDGLPVLGTLNHIPIIVADYNIQDAVIALPLRAHEQLIKVCRMLQILSVQVHVIPDLFALSFPSATLEGFGGIPVIDLGHPGIFGWQRLVKRGFDTIAVSLGLILLSPLLLLLAILIKLDSPGPVLYKQQRVGENGRLFMMFKFRSMHTNANPNLHKAYVTQLIKQNFGLEQTNGNDQHSLKLENDPRITRVGRFIRKASLDELPQLFNILRGEMSLVGPRPPIPYEVDLYQDWHKRRFEAIPGMTGVWQVRGRNRVSFDEMVRMDIEYIEHQSLWLDLKILLLTPLAVISGQGAG